MLGSEQHREGARSYVPHMRPSIERLGAAEIASLLALDIPGHLAITDAESISPDHAESEWEWGRMDSNP